MCCGCQSARVIHQHHPDASERERQRQREAESLWPASDHQPLSSAPFSSLALFFLSPENQKPPALHNLGLQWASCRWWWGGLPSLCFRSTQDVLLSVRAASSICDAQPFSLFYILVLVPSVSSTDGVLSHIIILCKYLFWISPHC